MAKSNAITGAVGRLNPFSKNFFLYNPAQSFAEPSKDTFPQVENNAHRPFRYPIPLQLERIRVDIATWRQAIFEAENAYVPYRVKMQQIFVDKILEGHVKSCISKRNQLTLKKSIKIGKLNSSEVWEDNKELSKLFNNKRWFKLLLTEILNAQYYGYSLIQLGDLIIQNRDYKFTNVMPLKRWLVRPDYYQYCQLPYSLLGFNFKDPEVKDENGNSYSDWLIYVDTPSDTGASICGYGLLYNVAPYAIILRNNLAHNADFNQMYVAPYRHMKTDEEYDTEAWRHLEESLSQMGTNGYVMTGMQEELEFITGNKGGGHASYGDLEERCQKLISKLFFGHANALDTQTMALGGGAKGMDIMKQEATPEGKAIRETEQDQDEFALSVLNDNVLPKLRNLGFPIPEDLEFYFPDDAEKFEQRVKEDAANKETVMIAVQMRQAGLKPNAEWFTERTGIPTEDLPEPPPQPEFGGGGLFQRKSFANKFERIKALYKHDHDH